MRVLISGSSGLIGGTLGRRLAQAGAEVVPLVREEGRPGILWQPDRNRFDSEAAEGADAVFHLAGEGVASGRWTEERKRRIYESRVAATQMLSEKLALLHRPPRVLAVASGIGFYGDAGEAPRTESGPAGRGFLAKVCTDWEAACAPALGRMRVVNVRIGIVLSAGGGALAQMLPLFKVGLGGRLGDGRQWMSWVSFEDVLRIFEFVLGNENVAGPVNAVSPNAVRNAEFAQIMASVLHRPAVLPAPAFVLRTLLGEMADELLLGGVRAIPQVLTEQGFRFVYPDLEDALRVAVRA
jgi:uncharacterized protein (TIGR01777 family)